MSGIMDKVDELIYDIKQDSIYQDYIKALQALNQHESLKIQVDNLRKRNFQLQNEAPQETIFDESSNLAEQFYEIRRNPLVQQYLDAEVALCKLLKEIGIRISGDMDIHLPS